MTRASTTESLLLLLSLAETTSEEKQLIRELAQRCDYRELFELADMGATVPLIWHKLGENALQGAMPPEVADRFRKVSDKVEQANSARLERARELFARFAKADIPVVILKGVLFAETIYRDPFYKKMNDVDILVRKDDMDRIFDIYEEMQLFCAAEISGGNPRKQEKFSHHAPPFFTRDLYLMVGTHWGLITPLAPYELDYDAIWSRVVDIDFHGLPAKSMAPEDNLHHLCVHLPYYKTGVRELADIYNLIRHYRERLDWNLLLTEVRKASTQNLVYHALSLSQALCPMPEVAALLAKIEPETSAYYRADAARKTASVSRLLRMRSIHMSRIEKAFSELNMTSDPREMRSAFLRMWRNILAPPAEDVLRMNSLDELHGLEGIKARLATPMRIYRVFERDLGAKIFALLVFKTAYETARESVLAPLRSQQSDNNLDAFARKLGLDPERFEALKEALE